VRCSFLITLNSSGSKGEDVTGWWFEFSKGLPSQLFGKNLIVAGRHACVEASHGTGLLS
jgi:hypothetical protein